MVLTQDFKEFIDALNKNNVRYLVVGGYAVAFHGHPRYTKDMDVWIHRDPGNAVKVVQALEDFGFASLGITEEDFLASKSIIQLGYPPNRIDLLTDIEGVAFETCFAAKVLVEVDGTIANFIDLENLKKNKQATGRLQDLADVENLSNTGK